MNQSLKDLESRLGSLTPRGLSNDGRKRCHAVLDALAEKTAGEPQRVWSSRHPRMATAAAAVLALGLGMGGGWFLGDREKGSPSVAAGEGGPEGTPGAFDQLDHQAWVVTPDGPDVVLDENGQVREVFREMEVTKEVVKHRESGIVVTVETTDHHLVDSIKSDF